MKILVVSEANWLNTGYAIYYKNICEALHNAGHKVTELASYGNENDPEHVNHAKNCPWDVFLNIPNIKSEAWLQYSESKKHRFDTDFCSWNFENIVLNCFPDVVIAIRDHWYDKFILDSPLSKYYKVILSPTIDSMPQRWDWLYTFNKVDALTFYTKWSEDWARTQFGQSNMVKHIPVAPSPSFRVMNQKMCRAKLGLPNNNKILLTVMRNQGRKHYPYLFEAFSKIEDQSTLLYCHTHFEDRGWDLPKLLLRNGIANRVYFTYKCKECADITSDLFKFDNVCKKCGANKEVCSVQDGAETEDLNYIYNSANLYIQWANCLKPDQEVLIKRDGKEIWCPISKVQTGDLSWTHKNRWCKVLNVWKNLTKSIDKKVLDLHICGDFDVLSCTENHEFPAYTKNEIKTTKSIREGISTLLSKNKTLPEFGKYELSQLTSGDMLLYPIDDSIQDIEKINILNEITLSPTTSSKNNPNFIDVDNDFCKFIGLFAADGCASSKYIGITSNIKDIDNISLAKNIFKKLGPNNSITEGNYKGERNAIDLKLTSSIYSNLFSKWFSKGENKQLPNWALKLPKEKQFCIIQGMFMGDGYYCPIKNLSIYSTISINLANQLKELLRRCRINFSCKKVIRSNHKIKDNKQRKDCYRFEIYGYNLREKIDNIIKNNGANNIYYENYHLVKIKNIHTNDYAGDVWCLEVENDHTMTTKICSTFQSEGFGVPQIEAAACGLKVITVNYSAPKDIATKINSFAVEPLSLQVEMGTLCNRAIPDNDKLIEILNDENSWIYDKSETVKMLNSNYSWKATGEKWVKLVESLEPKNNWNYSPILLKPPTFDDLKHLSNFDFVKECILKVVQDESLLGSMVHCESIEHLNRGNFIPEDIKSGMKDNIQKPVTKEMVYNKFLKMLEETVKWQREKNRRLSQQN